MIFYLVKQFDFDLLLGRFHLNSLQKSYLGFYFRLTVKEVGGCTQLHHLLVLPQDNGLSILRRGQVHLARGFSKAVAILF